MINVIWGSTNKPVSSRRLAEVLSDQADIEGTLYIGYPILGTPEGPFPFDALLLSPDKGVVVFDIVEGRQLSHYRERQDNLFSKLQSKLLQYQSLVKRRELLTPINVASFAPAAAFDIDDEYPVFSDVAIAGFIRDIQWHSQEIYPALAAAIQALSTIKKGHKKREIRKPDSRGAKLQKLNESIANLDVDQGAAVVETVHGVQRIRGLAGSGKTIVLALKVAYLYAQNPDWRIAVTFNTRSLKGQFERLINTFIIEQTNEEPDWKRVEILHSWGSPSAPGLYYRYARDQGLTYYDFKSAEGKFGKEREFSGACEEALNLSKGDITQPYDAILVDEAQDLPSAFLRLCYAYLKEPKRLVYAYDELQTLTNASVPAPEELFGVKADGTPVVQFSPPGLGRARQDIILERCYRNSRPILATAHALGFGIYREPGGLIQIFDRRDLWLDVGYRVRAGKLEDGQEVSLHRTDDTSPHFLEAHSPVDDILHFQAFNTAEEQDAWLVESIKRNLTDDELSANDIIVINPDPLSTRRAVSSARAMLFKDGINTSLAGISSSPDIFFEDDTVTFTGIFRAKGNEAAMVYVINAQDCHESFLHPILTRKRNRLFTAITRSKAWVRVLGVGPTMNELIAEYSRIRAHDFRLDFIYPDDERRKELRVINREMTRAEESRIGKRLSDLSDVVSAIEQGEVKVEDLPPSLRKKLKKLLD